MHNGWGYEAAYYSVTKEMNIFVGIRVVYLRVSGMNSEIRTLLTFRIKKGTADSFRWNYKYIILVARERGNRP